MVIELKPSQKVLVKVFSNVKPDEFETWKIAIKVDKNTNLNVVITRHESDSDSGVAEIIAIRDFYSDDSIMNVKAKLFCGVCSDYDKLKIKLLGRDRSTDDVIEIMKEFDRDSVKAMGGT